MLLVSVSILKNYLDVFPYSISLFQFVTVTLFLIDVHPYDVCNKLGSKYAALPENEVDKHHNFFADLLRYVIIVLCKYGILLRKLPFEMIIITSYCHRIVY